LYPLSDAGIAELIIFKESIRKIFEDVLGEGHSALDQFYTQPYFLVIIMALLETPPTLVSKMEKLKFMALSGVASITIFMVAFVIFFIFAVSDENPDNNPVGNMDLFPSNWFAAAAAVPNMMLSLSYQVNIFPLYKGMRNVTDKKYGLASLVGLAFCVFSYLLVGILGYAYAGSAIEANFLRSLLYSKIAPVFFFSINIFFLMSIFFAFPIMFFGCRNNFIALIKLVVLPKQEIDRLKGAGGDDVDEISSYINTALRIEDRKKKARLHFIGYTIGIYAVIVLASVLLESIESVFNLVGAVCSTSVSIFLPCFFYVKLTDMRKQPRGLKYYFSIVLFAVMAPYALFSIVALYV
jgi:amino acid permease